tara:strand:+ start:1814 stop:2503 length:690 start_codon:yes stop_codon:yes gene_type:complete
MMLFTNGCSFTYGGELPNPKQDSYPTILSNKLGCNQFVNYADNGSSNNKILRTTLDFLFNNKDNDDIYVVIGWSGISRTEWYDEHDLQWKKITPTMIDSDPYATAHYKYLQSRLQDNLDFYNQVLFLQLFLQKNNIKYFFFRIDNGNVKMKVRASSMEVTDGFDSRYIDQSRFNHIDLEKFPSYLNEQLSFKEYALVNNGGFKPGGHPDEKSHGIFADYLSKEIKKLYK